MAGSYNTVTRQQFATAVLQDLGLSASQIADDPNGIEGLLGLFQQQGTNAQNNPTASTLGSTQSGVTIAGSSTFNSAGVQNYSSAQIGENATAATLEEPLYSQLTAALKSNAPVSTIVDDFDALPSNVGWDVTTGDVSSGVQNASTAIPGSSTSNSTSNSGSNNSSKGGGGFWSTVTKFTVDPAKAALKTAEDLGTGNFRGAATTVLGEGGLNPLGSSSTSVDSVTGGGGIEQFIENLSDKIGVYLLAIGLLFIGIIILFHSSGAQQETEQAGAIAAAS